MPHELTANQKQKIIVLKCHLLLFYATTMNHFLMDCDTTKNGFYTTTNKLQAISFAEKVYKRKNEGIKTVSIYEIDEDKLFSECSVLRFDAPDEAWLDFVSENRSGEYKGEKYDVIFGPVADDDVYATFALYQAGVLNKEQTLETLKIKKLYNQMVFTTEKALSFLKFTGIVSVEEM